MKESEAKGKWCPLVRLIGTGWAGHGSPPTPTFNRVASGAEPNKALISGAANCIGSGCMMWRFEAHREKGYAEADAGFCGLAGTDGWVE